MQTVGVISDTHGLLRPQARAALAGVDLIVHAGDIGGAEILEELGRIAPVTAVRGNNDKGVWAQAVARSQLLEVEGCLLYVVHDIAEIDLDPAAAGIAVVITGHSHRPSIVEKQGVLFLNPGSAGPRRFTLPVALATLQVTRAGPQARIHTLDPG
jgi:uncharacterized protein